MLNSDSSSLTIVHFLLKSFKNNKYKLINHKSGVTLLSEVRGVCCLLYRMENNLTALEGISRHFDGFRPLFYFLSTNESSFERLEQVPKYLEQVRSVLLKRQEQNFCFRPRPISSR